MENTIAKRWLFTLLSVVLLLPFLQQCLHFVESGPLLGAFTRSPDVAFSYKGWLAGSYQKQKTLFLNDGVGFRPDLVRVNDQINCSVFRKLAGGDAQLGVDNYLFSMAYIDEYEGRMYCLSERQARDEIRKLKQIQDTLDRMGKTFVFTYAPSKPYIFPEKIPRILRSRGVQKPNSYGAFKRLSDSFGVRQLDFNALFMAMKDTAPDIFTKQGCHWSLRGSLLAADTLIKFIERERKIEMPEIVITKMAYSDVPRSPDNDLLNSINLIWPVAQERFCYPEYHYSPGDKKTKPKTVFIGDSFVWQWIDQGVMENATSDWEFWYYFGQVNDQKTRGGAAATALDNYDWPKVMLDADCVVVVFTPMNFFRFADSTMFIEKMYDYFYPAQK